MKKKPSSNAGKPQPTDAELAILRVLWAKGPSTVRDVHEALDEQKGVGYTTTLKLLQNMTEKGFCTRNDSQRSHVYRAAIKEAPTQRRMVSDLVAKAFGGCTKALVMQALSGKTSSKEEIAEIRRLLDEMEEKRD